MSVLDEKHAQGSFVKEGLSGSILGEHYENEDGVHGEAGETADSEQDHLINIECHDGSSDNFIRVYKRRVLVNTCIGFFLGALGTLDPTRFWISDATEYS